MKTIQEFCDTHYACRKGREWALANCASMQEAWDTAPNPRWVVWIATRKGVLNHRELVQFSLYCARSVQHLMKDVRSIQTLDIVERWLEGGVSTEELQQAKIASYASYAASYAADVADADVADADAYAAYAAAAAADVADADAVRQKQAAWLRENTKPNFE